MTLSGGQKARLSLARALYANRDIYLIDDVLVSIDRHVADHIFSHAIKDMLRHKTVLFVSSDTRRLTQCDQVVYIESGRIIDFGTHNQLHERCDTYRQYCTVSSSTSQNNRKQLSIDTYFVKKTTDFRDQYRLVFCCKRRTDSNDIERRRESYRNNE